MDVARLSYKYSEDGGQLGFSFPTAGALRFPFYKKPSHNSHVYAVNQLKLTNTFEA